MPSLKDIRRRISSVKSTQQITRAMKLVAAARMKRATETALAARPYSESLDDILQKLASEGVSHPLMEERGELHRIAVVVVTSDRGLCGAFNGTLLRRTEEWLNGREEEIELHLFGRKARDFFRRRDWHIADETINRDPKNVLEDAQHLAPDLAQQFLSGRVDEVWLAYNRFVSVMTQRPEFLRLAPVGAGGIEDLNVDLLEERYGELEDASLIGATFVFEPDQRAILGELLPLYLETRVYQIFLDSVAGELAARMRAMDAATRNAGELIDRLTLQFNRARQAAITRELVEIISGAEAL
jgi:F-type H+-transporting ATPase subunit gamma